MPKTGQTVQTENGETYHLAEWLGAKGMVAVWRGVAEESGIAKAQVAIKIANPAMQQQLDAEYDTLNHLLNAGAETWPGETKAPLVPAFIHKATLEPEGQAALVTELIRVDTLTKLVLDENDLVRRQESLVEPAYQYAWFLDFMHNQVGISQSDRKLGDLYWDAEQQRLIVLGWDVVEQDAIRAPEDVYKFGEMWYALLLGMTPALTLGVNTSHEWDQLSVAWRRVLEACLRPARQARPTAERLLVMMTQWRDAHLQTAEELYRAGRQALEQVKEDFWQSERAWWLLDMAWQKGSKDAHRLALEAENLFREREQRLLEDVKFNLELQMFSTAENALNEVESETNNSPEIQLQAARWRCLVDVAKTGMDETPVQFRDVVHHLTAAVEALEAGQWLKVSEGLEPVLDSLPKDSKTRVMLQSLERESDLYQTLTEASKQRGDGEFLRAAEKYQIARDLLSEIVYQSAVELTIVDLVYEKAECERLAETEGKLRDAQVQLPRLVNAGHYGEAKSLYDQVLLLTRGKVEARQALDAVFAPVQGLEALSQARQRPHVPAEELATQAQDLLARFPDNTAVQREAIQVIAVLLPELERLAHKARFIEAIDSTLNLGWTMQSLGKSARVADAILKRCNQAVANLEDKRAVYQQEIERILNDLPDPKELSGQVAQRSKLMVEASLQRYLETVMNALQCFRPDIATHAWNKIAKIISRIPDLKTAYYNEIELVDKEYQIQSQWNDETLRTLANWRKGLESKSLKLQDDDMERLDEYWQQTSSIFVGEVLSLAQSGRTMRSAFALLMATEHAKAMDDAHQKMLELLASSAPVIDCLEQLEAFDRQWRPELDKTAIPGQSSRHSEFMLAWRNRISQAQAMERTLQAVEHLLTLEKTPPTLVFQYLTRMEIMVETVDNEVLASCADRWQDDYDRATQLLISDQVHSADSVYLDQIKASFQQIVSAKAQQGRDSNELDGKSITTT